MVPMLRQFILVLMISSMTLSAFGQPVCCVTATNCCGPSTPNTDPGADDSDAEPVRCICCGPLKVPSGGSTIQPSHLGCRCEHFSVDALQSPTPLALIAPSELVDISIDADTPPELALTNGTAPVRRLFADRTPPLRL